MEIPSGNQVQGSDHGGLLARIRLTALDSLKAVMGDAVAMVMDAIDAHIECWFLQVLQLDARTLRLEALEIKDERLLYG